MQRESALFLAALVLVGLAVCAASMHAVGGGPGAPLEGDEISYARIATSMMAGEGYTRNGVPTTIRAPGLVAYIAPLFAGGPPPTSALRWYCAVPTILAAALAFLYWRRRGVRPILAGLMAAAFLVYPLILANAGRVIGESIVVALLVPWFFLALEPDTKSRATAVVAGALAGAAALTRMPLAPAVVLSPIVAVIASRRRGAGRGASIWLAVYLLVAALVYSPWPIRNVITYGRLELSSSKSGTDLWKSNNPDATGILTIDHGGTFVPYEESIAHLPEPEQSIVARARALDFIRANPGRFLELAAIRQMELWKPFSPRMPLIVNAAVGIPYLAVLTAFVVLVARRRRGAGTPLVLAPALAFVVLIALPFLLYPAIVRYRAPADAAMLWAVLHTLWGRARP